MESYVTILSKSNFNKFMNEKPQIPKVLWFTELNVVTPLNKALSKKFKEKLMFA